MARTRSRNFYVGVMTVVIAGAAIYWLRSARHPSGAAPVDSGRAAPVVAQPEGVPVSPVPPPPAPAAPAPATPAPVAAAASRPAIVTGVDSPTASAGLAEASNAIAAGNLIAARRALNAVVSATSTTPANEQIVQQLVKLADDTIFSSRVLQNDPLVLKHSVAPKENLQKIANTYKITVPLICRINNLANANAIRQGQPLKVINGPFHAVVCKSTFRLYVYCQDTLVRVFSVALGAEGTTPTGTWKLKNKLLKPTYYPPRGGETIASGDPKNPLGDYWMALEGVEGQAVGQERYGIHGTNEPDSIGKNVSMGCIRLRNEDVAQVYEMLVVHDSIVTVKD